MFTNSLKTPPGVEMQKAEYDEEEERPREEEEVKSFFCSKPPEGPTASEKRTHELTHMPFRSTCPACVQATTADWRHKL